MEKITSREILHQIREEAAKKISDSRCRILICAGTGCLAGGSGEIYRRMSKLAEENPDIDVEFGPEIAHGTIMATARWYLDEMKRQHTRFFSGKCLSESRTGSLVHLFIQFIDAVRQLSALFFVVHSLLPPIKRIPVYQ